MKYKQITTICLASFLGVTAFGQTAATVTVNPIPQQNGQFTQTYVGSNWQFGVGGTVQAPPTTSDTESNQIQWFFQATWLGVSNNEPTATGSAIASLINGATDSGGAEKNANSSATGKADLETATGSVSGPAVYGPTTNWDGGTPYTVQGSNLIFWYVGTNSWSATYTFHTTSLSATESVTSSGKYGGSASATALVQSGGTWGLVSSTIMVSPSN